MYREELAHKKIGTIAGIFITLGIVAAVLVIMFVTAFIGFLLNLPWFQLTTFGIIVVGAFFLVKYFMTDYIYLVENGAILFGRRLGSREKELATIPLRNIRKAGDYQNMAQSLSGKKKYRYTFHKKQEAYVIDCGNLAVIFSPTEELKKRLQKGGGKA